MKIFISWSGTTSRQVAEALKEWLPFVINEAEAWVSSRDIESGQNWNEEILNELAAADFGVVCVTKENQDSTWLNFEAGALVNAFGTGRVAPLAINLRPTDIKKPLGQFQGPDVSLDGITRLVQSLNSAAVKPLDAAHLAVAAKTFWPVLEPKILAAVDSEQTKNPRVRPDRELLEELVSSMRSLARQIGASHTADPKVQEIRNNFRSVAPKIHEYLLQATGNKVQISFSPTANRVSITTAEAIEQSHKDVVANLLSDDSSETNLVFREDPDLATLSV